MHPRYLIAYGFLLILLSACATNPVTGKRELSLVGESTELEIGKEQYAPSRQMQGGDYTADPALDAYVNRVGQRLAAVSDRKLPYEFKVVDSSVPNAWALPGGKIAVNRGLLLELDNEAELAAVLGHEAVHAAARHGAKGMERGMLLQGAVMAAGVATAMATDNQGYAALAVGGATLGTKLVTQKYGRDAEREADHYGMEYMVRAGYDPEAAVTLQETFVRLSKEQRQDWLSGLFASHPPSQERVENNRADARRLGGGKGKLGRAEYQRAIAHLKRTKPAYDAYDQGVKALQAGHFQQARALADKALRIEPKEGKFYALKGDVAYQQKHYRSALTSYDRALQLNPDYFAFYLQRGRTKKQLGDLAGARADLSRSSRLLPNADALNLLGQLALVQGDKRRARDYFRDAAESQSAAGKAARNSLTKLELSDHPERHIKVGLSLDRHDRVVASIANPTTVALQDVRISVRYRERTGRVRELRSLTLDRLGAGESHRVSTGLGPISVPSMLQRLQAVVIGARVAR